MTTTKKFIIDYRYGSEQKKDSVLIENAKNAEYAIKLFKERFCPHIDGHVIMTGIRIVVDL